MLGGIVCVWEYRGGQVKTGVLNCKAATAVLGVGMEEAAAQRIPRASVFEE